MRALVIVTLLAGVAYAGDDQGAVHDRQGNPVAGLERERVENMLLNRHLHLVSQIGICAHIPISGKCHRASSFRPKRINFEASAPSPADFSAAATAFAAMSRE